MSDFFASLGIAHIGLFVSAVMLLNLTPGPDTAYIVGRSLAQGPRAGVLSAIGICLGCCVHSVLCAVGLTALLAASSTAFVVIKFVGALYLVFLSTRMLWQARAGAAPGQAAVLMVKVRGTRALLVQGFLTNIFNPKVILFFVAFFPQFVLRDSPSKAISLLGLGGIFFLMSLVYNCAVGVLAGQITQRVRKVPSVSVWLERGVGSAFLALGVRLAFIEKPL